MTDSSLDQRRQQIRQARGKFLAMAGTYFLGVLNDNFLKQAAMLMAVAAGLEYLQGYATVLFTLPFIVFAAHAGWLADRFPKRRIVIAAKVLELAAACCGAAGLVTCNWMLILAMVAMMGLQAAIFSPSLNGSIPELYPVDYVTQANALLKIASTAAILIGIASAGFVLDAKGADIAGAPFGQVLAAVTIIGVALVGVLSSLGVPRRPAADPKVKFPWAGPFNTLGVLWSIRLDRLLTVTILMDAFVWFAGSLQVLQINLLGLNELGLSKASTSGLVVAELLGIAAGGALAGKIATGPRWYRVLVPAGLVMGAAMLAMKALPGVPEESRFVLALGLLAVAGMSGGLLLIPLESFIQIRPPAQRKGAVIAAGNFAAFSAILVSGPASSGLYAISAPSSSIALLGGTTLVVSVALLWALRRAEVA